MGLKCKEIIMKGNIRLIASLIEIKEEYIKCNFDVARCKLTKLIELLQECDEAKISQNRRSRKSGGKK